MLTKIMKKVIANVLKQVEDKDWGEVPQRALAEFDDEMILNTNEKWLAIWRVKQMMGGTAINQHDFERFMRREIWI